MLLNVFYISYHILRLNLIINSNSSKPTTCILAPAYILNVIYFHNTISRIRYLLIARMLRLIRILMHVKRYRAFIATFLTLIPSLMPYLGTVFCVMCVYCTMGIQVLSVFMLGFCFSSFVLHNMLCVCSLYISFFTAFENRENSRIIPIRNSWTQG